MGREFLLERSQGDRTVSGKMEGARSLLLNLSAWLFLGWNCRGLQTGLSQEFPCSCLVTESQSPTLLISFSCAVTQGQFRQTAGFLTCWRQEAEAVPSFQERRRKFKKFCFRLGKTLSFLPRLPCGSGAEAPTSLGGPSEFWGLGSREERLSLFHGLAFSELARIKCSHRAGIH